MSLRFLEERLTREAPALSWSCSAASLTDALTATNLPEEIKVVAMMGGVPIEGGPFFLSGECLHRWGLDASATLICNEMTPRLTAKSAKRGLDWDRLAEF